MIKSPNFEDFTGTRSQWYSTKFSLKCYELFKVGENKAFNQWHLKYFRFQAISSLSRAKIVQAAKNNLKADTHINTVRVHAPQMEIISPLRKPEMFDGN